MFVSGEILVILPYILSRQNIRTIHYGLDNKQQNYHLSDNL